MPAGRQSQKSSTKKPKTICIAGAACALLTWRKPTWIAPRSTKWAIGTEPAGIGIRIMVLIRSFPGMESSIARLVGVSFHRLTWASRRLGSSATSTTILTTFVTFTMGTTLPAGDTLATGAGLVMQGTLPRSIMKLTTTIMSTTASTLDPGILFIADSPAVHKWRTGDTREANDSTALVEQDSMGAEEDFTVVAGEDFTVAAVVEAIAEARNIAKPKSGGNGNRDADASRFFCAIRVV